MTQTGRHTTLDRREAARTGMTLAVHAREAPDRPAIIQADGSLSFDELNARSNRLARTLRRCGLGEGDSLAVMCSNRAEFAEAFVAGMRCGLRVTPINWHLTAEEAAYIVANCEARALIGDAAFAETLAEIGKVPGLAVSLAVGGEIAGFDAYDAALAAESPEDLADPVLGNTMLYTSGTTGRPKGVLRSPAGAKPRTGAIEVARWLAYRPGEDLNLCTGPLYHAAPLAFSLSGPLSAGVGVVLMDRWDARRALELIERHRITHSHMVPTMFHRLLSLPEEERESRDLSSLRVVLHGAAPCPVHIKQALIDWLGPIVYEYYAATEGWCSFVTPSEWLERPGTVGRPAPGQVRIRGESGEALPPGEVGTIFLLAPEEDRFEYYNDSAKTLGAYDDERSYFTLGDMGQLDEDGYLFLSDRSADVIISGGVNIYPAEVDAVLLSHPAVEDAATIGVPSEDWGEEVRSVVQIKEGLEVSADLERELIETCRKHLAGFKCPRKVDFVPELPRHDTGKIYRRRVREKYWRGRDQQI